MSDGSTELGARPQASGVALGRVEEADHADLLGEAVRNLDDTLAGEVGVLGEERHRGGVHDLARGVAHGHDGRVAVAEQVDVFVAEAQRLVDLDGLVLGLLPGNARANVGRVVEGIAERVLVLGVVDRNEFREREPVGAQRVRIEPTARADGVVVAEGVRERLALRQHLLARVDEAAADADRDQDAHERHVEDEVAGLAQVAALGARGLALEYPRAVAALAQHAPRRGDARRDLLVAGLDILGPTKAGQAVEACRGLRRSRSQRREMVHGSRDDAADERDEQQDVDGREPDRRVGVEHAEEVEHLRPARVRGLVGDDAVGVGGLLRHERTGHRGEGDEQQQEQRRAHARELPPEEAQVADGAELRLDDVGLGSGRVEVVGRALRVGALGVGRCSGVGRARGRS